MTLLLKNVKIIGMEREELFEKLKNKYTDYLYGKCSFSVVSKIEEQLHSLAAQEASTAEEIEPQVKEISHQIEDIEGKVKREYDKEIGEPLVEELLELLKFKGLIKGPEYYKRALELKEKLKKYDNNLEIRKKAAYKYLISEKGISPKEVYKITDLLLELGALYLGNFWVYEEP